MGACKLIKHRMVRPFDGFVRVVAVDLDAMQISDMLHIRSVGTQNPGIGWNLFAENLRLEYEVCLGIGKIRQLVVRLEAVVGPEETVFLADREVEQACLARYRVFARHPGAPAVRAVPKMVKDTAHIPVDHIPYRQVGAEVRAIGANDMGFAFEVAPDDNPAVEEVESAHKVGGRGTRHTDR